MYIQDSERVIGRVSKVPEIGTRVRAKAQVGGAVFQKTVKQLTFGGPIKELVDHWIHVFVFHKCVIFLALLAGWKDLLVICA